MILDTIKFICSNRSVHSLQQAFLQFLGSPPGIHTLLLCSPAVSLGRDSSLLPPLRTSPHQAIFAISVTAPLKHSAGELPTQLRYSLFRFSAVSSCFWEPLWSRGVSPLYSVQSGTLLQVCSNNGGQLVLLRSRLLRAAPFVVMLL
jgi:hypothetical protein